MIPTVGRIVHYTNLGDADGKYPPETQAAIITKAVFPEHQIPFPTDPKEGEYKVSLCIFYTTGFFFMDNVPYSVNNRRGHWTWPPRV